MGLTRSHQAMSARKKPMKHVDEVQEENAKWAKMKAGIKKARVPKDVRQRVAAHLKKNRELLWDMALARVESEELELGKRRKNCLNVISEKIDCFLQQPLLKLRWYLRCSQVARSRT